MPASNAYPQLPFPNYSWRLSHHTGAVDEQLLYQLLLAASLHLTSHDPVQDINSYIVNNGLLPSNVRTDSGQADVWRDYQQVLSETGLMFSTRSGKAIRFTATGLGYLDRTSSQKDILTIQTFRWQYPNGHNTQRSSGDGSGPSFATQQMASGILIRPAVLVWQVLRQLRERGEEARLSALEIEHFLIPARTHQDTDLVVETLLYNRRSPQRLTKVEARRRNANDWIKRLSRTHAFELCAKKHLSLSKYSLENIDRLCVVMDELIGDNQWWFPPTERSKSEDWYQWYGTQNSASYPIPFSEQSGDASLEEGEGAEENGEASALRLREYQHIEGFTRTTGQSVSATYAADLSESAHRLHDTMVRLIAERCLSNGARVFVDPKTVDLLVEFSGHELLLEVKSATSANYVRKLRSALGQVCHYDFLRSKESQASRRKALALTIDIPETHWSREFVSDYLDMDLVALRSGALHLYTHNEAVKRLFSSAA